MKELFEAKAKTFKIVKTTIDGLHEYGQPDTKVGILIAGAIIIGDIEPTNKEILNSDKTFNSSFSIHENPNYFIYLKNITLHPNYDMNINIHMNQMILCIDQIIGFTYISSITEG